MTLSIGWLPGVAYLYLLIFSRVGTMLMLMPAFGNGVIPARMRLSLALLLSLVFYPLVSQKLPAEPDGILGAVAIMGHEIAVGLILGGIARMILSAAQTAGAAIAYQMGLSVAQTADPSQEGVQGAIVGNFIGMLGVALIFAMDLHHLVLAAIYQSYTLYPPQMPLMFGDAAKLAIEVAAKSFLVGVQLASPFIVFGMIFYLGLGLLSKLMPQLQVFFIAMPAGIGIGFLLLMLLLGVMMSWYITHVQTMLTMLTG